MEKPTQPSFLTKDGKIDPSLVPRDLQTDLQNSFNTKEQAARAGELIASGAAKDIAEARRIMSEEDLEDNLDSYRNRK